MTVHGTVVIVFIVWLMLDPKFQMMKQAARV